MSDPVTAAPLQPALFTRPRVTLIAALSENGVIGCRNRLPWHLPDDLKHFKSLTIGHPIIMGRKTFESIGQPLPRRLNLVLSHSPSFAPCGVTVVRSVADALAACADQETVFVIGGAQIYALFLPCATRLELTRVHTTLVGDAYFPRLDLTAWRYVSEETHGSDERHAYRFTWQVCERA